MTQTLRRPPLSQFVQSQTTPIVLCIDDDPDISYAIETRLRDYVIEWRSAYYGTQGIWTCLNDRPDVVILDYNLPQGRGDLVLETLRNNRRTSDIPVIVLSGHPQAFSKLKHSADSFLPKPLDAVLLINELSQYIELRKKTDGEEAQL